MLNSYLQFSRPPIQAIEGLVASSAFSECFKTLKFEKANGCLRVRARKKNIFSLGALKPTLEFRQSDWLLGSDHLQPISHGSGPALTQYQAT